jgi:hypothetical protein
MHESARTPDRSRAGPSRAFRWLYQLCGRNWCGLRSFTVALGGPGTRFGERSFARDSALSYIARPGTRHGRPHPPGPNRQVSADVRPDQLGHHRRSDRLHSRPEQPPSPLRVGGRIDRQAVAILAGGAGSRHNRRAVPRGAAAVGALVTAGWHAGRASCPRGPGRVSGGTEGPDHRL